MVAHAERESAQKEAEKHGFNAKCHGSCRGDDKPGGLAKFKLAKGLPPPYDDGVDRQAKAGQKQHETSNEAALGRETLRKLLRAAAGGVEILLHGVGARELREHDALEADKQPKSAVDQGVNVEVQVADGNGAGLNEAAEHHGEDHKGDAGKEEEPVGAEQQHKAKMPPAVAPRPKMRWAATAVGRKGRWYFGQAHAHLGSTDNHLRGKLHPGGVEVHTKERVL